MARGNTRLSKWTEWKIIGLLLTGMVRKEVARQCKCSLSTVAKTKAAYPLFFYKKLPEKIRGSTRK